MLDTVVVYRCLYDTMNRDNSVVSSNESFFQKFGKSVFQGRRGNDVGREFGELSAALRACWRMNESLPFKARWTVNNF